MSENLQCSVCGKQASVHLTQIVNNKIQKIDLCEHCAQQKGVTDPEGFSLADLLAKSGAGQSDETEEIACPSCGYTTADFRRTGRLGCPSCYTVFQSVLEPVLEDMHSGTRHVGKVPENSLRRANNEQELARLRQALDEAVSREDYESAAEYRDRIRQIENAEAEVGSE